MPARIGCAYRAKVSMGAIFAIDQTTRPGTRRGTRRRAAPDRPDGRALPHHLHTRTKVRRGGTIKRGPLPAEAPTRERHPPAVVRCPLLRSIPRRLSPLGERPAAALAARRPIRPLGPVFLRTCLQNKSGEFQTRSSAASRSAKRSSQSSSPQEMRTSPGLIPKSVRCSSPNR